MKAAETEAERCTGRVRKGQTVSVQTAAYPDQSFEGAVFFISPSIRESTRDLLLKARIDNPRGMLRPGGFADMKLVLEVRRQALVLPEEALVPTRTGYNVFVVEDRLARQRDVAIELRKPGIVEIREGLQAGQTVVRAGHISLADGDRVQVVGNDKPDLNVPAESENATQRGDDATQPSSTGFSFVIGHWLILPTGGITAAIHLPALRRRRCIFPSECS